MKYSNGNIRFKRKTFIHFIVVIIILMIATPALAEYLGPDRTVTEATSTCKVILYECQYIASKSAWKYHKVGDWSCSNESKPWTAYSSNPSSQGCLSATAGDTYWSKEEVLQEVTITYPPATISNSLQNCNLNNGWCNTSPELTLDGIEPVTGYDILAIEGSLNGQIFACPSGNCSIPLNEGNNDFTFWALSSWGDSSEMGTFSSKVDTVPPTLGLDITASNGTNGWYVSQTSISATGSDSTSGLLSVLLSVNNGPWESSTILNEGVYDIDVQAEDNAGNKSNTSSTISIDTTTPSIDVALNGSTGNNGWYKSDLEIIASASDATSGVNTFDASIDGSAYADYNSPITFSDGIHTIQFKATDQAGNETQTPVQEFHIDTIAPVVDIPSSGEVNEPITYKVKDDGSGLASLRVVIEDEDERYAKIAWNENVSGYEIKDNITWDGKFKDGTVAPAGEYLIWIKASDIAGNESIALSIVNVSSPFSLLQFVPEGNPKSTSPTPPKELFEDGVNPAENSSSPTINFGGITTPTKEQKTTTLSVSASAHSASTSTNSNILWGAAATSAIGAVALYAREEKRKREEEAERKRAEIEARIAEQAERKKEAEQARKIAQWLEGQAILKAEIEERKILSANHRAEDKESHLEKGMRSPQALETSYNLYMAKERAKIQSANNRVEQKEASLEEEMESYSAKPEEWETAYTAYMAKKAIEEYRAGEKAEYAVESKEKSWLEKTIVDPAKKILNSKTFVGAILATAVGSTAIMAANIASNPHVFDEARANVQSEWQQVVQAHPEIQADQATKRKYLFSHPYEAFSAGYDAAKAIANSLAGFADAAWQQNPLGQAISNGMKQIGNKCPEGLGESWYRRCSATLHFGSSLVEHPADTLVGVGTALIADPLAGAVKTTIFSLKYNNPISVISDISNSIQRYGLGEGIQEFIDDRVSLTGQLFSDPQVKSFGLLALFMGAAFIPVIGTALATIGGGALVLKQTISSFLQIDKVIQAAPTREDVAKYASSQEIRRSVSVNLALLALVAFGAFRGVKELNQYKAFQETLSPSTQRVLADLPITRQFEILDLARELDLSTGALEFYLSESARPGSTFVDLPLSDALKVSSLAEQSGQGALIIDYVNQYGVTDALRIATPEVIKGMVNDKILVQTQEMLSQNTGYNISSEVSFSFFSEIGKSETYITSKPTISEVIGNFEGKGSITISQAEATALETSLGLRPGSLSEGFRISKIRGINEMDLHYPVKGNNLFLGPGKGLPGGGPEVTISPPLPIDSTFIVEQIIVEVLP